ncbi:MAG: bifunctional 23S rRNA (guanine(2069)-N(7))-methyltransferase RlmK/23S rRNA (guanine(2445)-N(2))-methyltransferase RlmL, partial [Spirochaetaceae bacterium]|nr:bifunctional 23S rRNA (guanine(2069)-N(7))-methyltransferase RlmK/23S rRNA (guanine(2445)-N(2))-methyltransferase RlmL [Spirochaetaceae bacterium]
MKFFAPCPPGAEYVLAGELKKLGAGSVVPASRGVGFEGDLNLSYRACLELRTASRILVELASDRAGSEDELYRLANSYPWDELFSSALTISCRATGVPREKDPRYATLKLKDAVADRFNDKTGSRPYVDRKFPDIRIEARWDGRNATIYLNWSGRPLHERGYRLERTDAVLRETSAAAILAESGWPEIAENGGGFVDPVCGSGTLLAEAAMMAVGAPPGIHRKDWGFEGLSLHKDNLWRRVFNDASIFFGESLQRMPLIAGFDNDESALRTARANLRRAGLNNVIRLEHHDITTGRPSFWPAGNSGLICADPPYGVRIQKDPTAVYNALGNMFRNLESGWRMAILAPDKKTASATFLRAQEYHHTVSGGMDLILAIYNRIGGSKKTVSKVLEPKSSEIEETPSSVSENEPALKKLLQKNIDAMSAWAENQSVSSYRIWDADIPEFNAAVDWFEGRWLHVQEFAPSGNIPQEKIRSRLNSLISVLKELTGCLDENLYLKTWQRGIKPNRKTGEERDRFIIRENGMKFYINLEDYLDTGVFLDHRSTRALIR